ncbi:MAG: hypothetical protein HOM95_11140, partial [Halieaceae bacterium]|nr:hypothetical protein [Halieaceae bacterium]
MHCFDLPEFNVVIAGGGSIGRALLEEVQLIPGFNQAIVLERNPDPSGNASAVLHLKMDAKDPDSIK